MRHNPRKSNPAILTRAAAALLALLCSSCSPQASKERHLAQADKYFESGQYDLAEIEYKNVLQAEALNPQAIVNLGLIYCDQGRLGRALPYLLKGRQLQPDNLDLRLKLGQIDLASGNLKEALDEANFILRRNPRDPEAPLLLVETAIAPKEIEEVRERLQKPPLGPAGSAPILVALGSLDFRQHNFKDAETAFKQALAIDPKSSSANYALGTLLWGRRDLSHADQAFAAAAKLSPVRSPKRLEYAEFKIQTGDPEAAGRMLEELTREAPDYVPAWMLLAEIAGNERKYDESETLIAKVLARDPVNPEALLLSARIRLANGETNKAVAELERMREVFPKSAPVYYQLGQAYLAGGDIAKAVTSLNQAVKLAPNYADAILLLAGTDIRTGAFKEASASLKRLVQQRPDLVRARLLLADAYIGQGDFEETLDVYHQLEQSYPRDPEPLLLAGLALLREDKRDEARRSFNQALELAPAYLPAIEQLINVDLIEKNYPAALERANAEIEKNPKLAGPRLLQAKVFLAQNDPGRSEAALSKAIELQPDSPTAYFLLARLYATTNRQQKALADLREVVAKNPRNVAALMLTGIIYNQQKNYTAARDAYEKLLAINPNFGSALNNLAYLYSENFGELDQAYKTAQRARVLMPNEPNLADTLGWILYKKHQYSWALDLLQESADRLPTDAEVQFHLGMTHYMLGEEESARLALQQALQLQKEFPGSDDARQHLAILAIDAGTDAAAARATLEKALADQKDDPIALSRLAAIDERKGAIDKAVADYEAALRASPANVNVMMNLTRLYTKNKDTQKAFELAKTARKLEPDNPDLAHVLGRLAFQTGDYPWALSLLQEAARSRPEDPEALYDLAEASYAVGQVPEAEAAMRHALQAGASGLQADMARRFLDMIALSANPIQAAAAAERVEDDLKSDSAYVPALMVLAEIDEQTADSGAAMQTYQKVLNKYPDFAPAQKRLAILYAENPENDQKARDLAIKAREIYPDDPELEKAFGIVLYRQKDFTTAANLLQECARQRSGDADAMFYLGMAQYHLDKRAESKQSLQKALKLNLRPDLAAQARRTISGSE